MKIWRPASESDSDRSERSEMSRNPPYAGVRQPSTDRAGLISRESDGVQCLFDRLPDTTGLRILDLGMLTEGTPQYLGGLGHRVYTASLLHSFDLALADAAANSTGSLGRQGASRFVRQHLDFPPQTFHAVLAWDVLQHLDQETMYSTVAHLAKIVRPNGAMLCIFHMERGNGPVPVFDFAVDSNSTILIREAGHRAGSRELNTRGIESLFPQFRAVHFYLRRDALLEVLVLN